MSPNVIASSALVIASLDGHMLMALLQGEVTQRA